jgi:gliding motility-associated-like protein
VGGSSTGATVAGLPAGVTGTFSAGVFTISGTPTASGIFNYTVTTTGGCVPAATAVGTITVTTSVTITLTSAAATTNQSVCINNAITNITYSVGGSATGATVAGLPAGVTGIFVAGVFTISGTPTVSGIFNYTVTTTGGCTPAATSGGTITVTTLATIALTSPVATTNQSVCVNTAIVNITYSVGGSATGATVAGLPAGVTGTFLAGVFTISGTPTASGIFNYTVTTTGGCVPAATAVGTITVTTSATIALTSAAATTNQSVCINNAITNITYSVGGSATGATVAGLPAGVTGIFAAGVFTISGTPTVSGIFNYTVTTTGGCVPAATAGGTVTITTSSTIILTSPVATTNQTVCVNTAIVNITYSAGGNSTGATVIGLPAGITGTFSAGVFTISGTPSVSGTFNYTVTTTGGCTPDATAGGTVIVTPLPTLILISAAVTTTQTICINAAIANITYSIGGSGIGATVTGLPTGVSGTFSAGVFTISGTPSVAGTFSYTVTTTGGCTPAATLGGTITVTPLPIVALTSAAATTAQTICINTAIANITYSVGGSATGATVTGLPAGISGTFSAGVFTISGTPSVSGIFNYTVTTTGGCTPAATLVGTITVTPLPTVALTSAAATTAQTICINTAIVNITYSVGGSATGATVTGLPTGISGTFAAGVFTISGTPSVAGIFNYTVTTTGGCTPAATLGGTITVTPLPIVTLTSAVATTAQTICINTAIADITYSVGGSATGATVTGLPTGISGTFVAGVFTISGIPSVSGIFNYTVTTTGGCAPVVTSVGTITVTPLPTVALTSAAATTAQTICINTAIVNITYSMGGSATGATVIGLPTGIIGTFSAGVFTISGTPSVAGIFNYTVTTTGGCTPAATLGGTITVTPLPIVTLTSAAATTAQTICINTAIANVTYSIGGSGTGATIAGLPTGINGTFVAGVFTIIGIPSVAGIFNYTVTTTGGCIPAATLGGTITVTPLPTVVLTSAAATTAQTICVNAAIATITCSIGGSGTGATVSGLPTGVAGTFAAGVFTISGTPSVAGTFNYTVMTTGGCTPAATIGGVIVVNPMPDVIATPTSEIICSGQTTGIVLTSNLPGTTFSWTVSQTFVTGASAGNGNNISQVLTATGTVLGKVVYAITPTLNGCLGLPIIVTVVVTPAPIINATPSTQTICSGNTTAIVLSSSIVGTIYNWNVVQTNVTGASAGSGAAIAQILSTVGNNSGEVVYAITPIVNGCPGAVVMVTISVNPIPVIVASVSSNIICSGSNVNIVLTSNIAGTTFSWAAIQTGVLGASLGNGNTIAQTLTTVGAVQGTVDYIITPIANGCAGTSITITITVKPMPEVFGAPLTTICSGESSNITLSPSIPGTIFSWEVTQTGVTGASDGTVVSSPFVINQILSTTATTAGAVIYKITPSANGCTGIPIFITVAVNPSPVPVIKDGIICVEPILGNLIHSYLFDTGLNNASHDFVWYLDQGQGQVIISGATGSTYEATQIGVYSVQVTNTTTGCVSVLASANVTESNPGLIISVVTNGALSDNPTIIVNVTGGNAAFLYQLDDGALQDSNVFAPVMPGLHVVKVTDVNGCTYLTTEVLVIGYPHFFTPNGDGFNDTWNIIGLSSQPNSKIYIFDRYGKLIKEISPAGQGWDGTYNGHLLPSTDYWFTVDYFETGTNKIFKAHFSLKR